MPFADAMGTVQLLLLSVFSATAHLQTFFKIESRIPSMSKARDSCREHYTDLVTVYNEEDNTNLATLLRGHQKAWVGLFRSRSSAKWSNGDDVTFSNLTRNSSISGKEPFCAAMKTDGSWESLNCTENRNFMCYKKDVSNRTVRLNLIPENLIWYEAQSHCRKFYTDLVSIRDQTQNEEVKKEGRNSSGTFWIGLLRDDWEWSDGGRSAYRNWAKYQPRPSSNCTVMMNSTDFGKWYSVPCDNAESALCYFINTTDTSPTVSEGPNITEKLMPYMSEAQSPCKANSTYPVIIHNDNNNTKIAAKIKNGKNIWLGLCRSHSSEKWSNGDNVTFSNLTGNCGRGPCCAALKADGSWESLQCTERRNFVCYIQDVTNLTFIYDVILEPKTWYEAQSHCRKFYTDLVSIRDQIQNEEVKREGRNSSGSFWIGLLRDDWEWADGGRSAYRNWGNGQPKGNLNCTMMINNVLQDGKWYSVECDLSYFNNSTNSGGHSHIAAELICVILTLHYFYNSICH